MKVLIEREKKTTNVSKSYLFSKHWLKQEKIQKKFNNFVLIKTRKDTKEV
jgi:hypothetical protein